MKPNQRIIDMMSNEDRKAMGYKSGSEIEADREKNEAKSEKLIQKTVEAYLVQLGYESRSSDSILRGVPKSGFYYHLSSPKRNPIMLDLLILGNDGRFMELELKKKGGVLSDEQAVLFCQWRGNLAFSSRGAMEIIKEWHDNAC